MAVLAASFLHGEAPSAGRGPGDPESEIKQGRVTSRPSEYWLGIQCRPVDDALRAHLKLAPPAGLVVEDVVPDSPAAQAGMKQHDILLSAGGKPLHSVGELIDAVEAARAGKDLSLEFLRGGEKKAAAVRPVRRPEGMAALPQPLQRGNEPEVLRKWLEELQSGEPGTPMRFRFYQPGMILPPDTPSHPPIPENVTVTIVKHGSDPAKVTVARDGKQWAVTENELEKLPKELRACAEQVLGRAPAAQANPVRRFDFVPEWPEGRDPGQADGEVEERLDALHRHLDQLQRAINEMRKTSPGKRSEK